jgi:hypothetical protein
MSTQRIKTLNTQIPFTSTWAAGVLTVTTNAVHNLVSGDVISLAFSASPQEINGAVVTVTSTVQFTIPSTMKFDIGTGLVIVPFVRGTGTKSFTVGKGAGEPTIFQCVLAGTGALTANVLFQASLNNINWVTLSTVVLSGTTTATDGFTSSAVWPYMQINVTSITGTNAKLTTMVAS